VVRYELTGRVALITIDRPEVRNAVDKAVAAGIEDAIDRLEADDEAWVGILTGTPPAFCSGADLNAVSSEGGLGSVTERGGFAGIVRRERTKPIIAAVEGPALAGGTEIVLACDLVVASTAAYFGLVEVKRSLIAAADGLLRLGRKLPPNVAMEAVLTGDPIRAENAHRYGLVNEVCDPGQAVERARALAERICANAPLAVRESRRLVLHATEAAGEEGRRLVEEAVTRLVGTDDFHEGIAAFLEKRTPDWRGR
jgi:enoyl-CoA hydratase